MDLMQELNKLEERRQKLLSQTAHLTTEQYNQIPEGSSNNIIWNMGHLLVTGEGMLYRNSSFQRLQIDLDRSGYNKGSKPEDFINDDEIWLIRESLLQSIRFYKLTTGLEQTTQGYKLPTEASNQLISEDGLQFLFFHEELHYQKVSRLMTQLR